MSLLRLLMAILVLIFCFAIPLIAYSAAVTLAWDPNNERDLAGYNVHYGTASRSYTATLSVGKATSFTLSGLAAGQTYYFSATALASDGAESGYSQEVSYTVPDGSGGNASNTPPGPPTLLSPVEGETADPAPTLQVRDFSDPDPGDGHSLTRWQIFREADSRCVLDIQTETAATDLKVPRLVLEEGHGYFWRAWFVDSHGAASEWSDFGHFAVAAGGGDLDADGIADAREVAADADVDGDGVRDSVQAGLKAVKAAGSSRQMALSIAGSATALAVEAIAAEEPEHPDFDAPGRPARMPFGVISFRLRAAQPGDDVIARLYFSEPVPPEGRWYAYDPPTGAWQDASELARFAADRRSVTLALKDGGSGDADGVANNLIVEQAGIGIPDAVPRADLGTGSSGSGGGGCFVSSACAQTGSLAALIIVSLLGALGWGLLQACSRDLSAAEPRLRPHGLSLATAPSTSIPAGPRRSRSARRGRRSSACSGWRLRIF